MQRMGDDMVPLISSRKRNHKQGGSCVAHHFYLCAIIGAAAWTGVVVYMLYQTQRKLSHARSWSLGNVKAAPNHGDNRGVTNRAGRWGTMDGSPTVLFAHRGEKILVPEHTLPAYEIASVLEAEYVEPDLVLTRDDVFVCHHDLNLRDGTDVADKDFDDLSTVMPDGTIDWYIRNFTLAQLKTLKIKQQNVGIRPLDFDFMFTIPTFEEYLQVIHRMTYKLNRTIGIVPELKEPAFHNRDEVANHMEKEFLKVMASNGYPTNSVDQGSCKAEVDGMTYDIDCPPTIIQCFEKPALEYLRNNTDLDLLMLIENDARQLTYEGMKEISKVAKYYSTWKEHLYAGPEADLKYNNVTWNATEIAEMGGFIPAADFVTEAHRNGMKIVLYTIKDSREPSTRGCALPGGCEASSKTVELDYFFKMGVDGIFVENVAESREIRMEFEFHNLLRNSAVGGSRNSFGNLATAVACAVVGYYCR